MTDEEWDDWCFRQDLEDKDPVQVWRFQRLHRRFTLLGKLGCLGSIFGFCMVWAPIGILIDNGRAGLASALVAIAGGFVLLCFAGARLFNPNPPAASADRPGYRPDLGFIVQTGVLMAVLSAILGHKHDGK